MSILLGLPKPVAVLVYATLTVLSLAVYRLYFHRISHIPGPKVVALTYWYQSYYDLWPHKGRFNFKLKELHDVYGPIVRIGPGEVSVRDARFYSEMYPATGRKRDKSTLWWWLIGWKPLPMGSQDMSGKPCTSVFTT